MGAEGFTILAVLEATDRISRVIEHIDAGLNDFSATAERAGAVAESVGSQIDEGLLQTASGADAVALANARMEAAQARATETAEAQANAERGLLEAQAQLAASADGDAEASARMAAAADALTAAQKRAALAAKEASAAEDHQAAVTAAQVAANDRVAESYTGVAVAANRGGEATAAAGAKSGIASKALGVTALAVAAIGYESIKSAGNFESLTEHLVTDGGESQGALEKVRAGILSISTATGTSSTEIDQAMLHIESAGFHAAAGLDVLTTAAEGAKVGGASLDTMGKALTGTMNAFGPSAGTATQMMNAMIATVASGDVKMEDLGSSLGNVAGIAASAGLSYAQVGGAIATMTAQNFTAQRATQDLAHTIQSLGNAQGPAVKEMQALGLNSNKIKDDLGKVGLTGTIQTLTQAIAAHTKGGDVLISTYNNATQAAANANTMIKSMPAGLQKLAEGYLSGSTTALQWKTALKGLPPIQAALMGQFATLANKTHSFNSLLASGAPAAQTYNAAMAKMVGGTTGLTTVLAIGGPHLTTYKDNVDKIAAAQAKTGKSVLDWDKIQGTFNQKMSQAKAAVEAAGVSIGTALLPAVSQVASVLVSILGPVADFIAKHQKLAGLVVTVAGSMLLMAAAMKAVEIQGMIIEGIIAVINGELDADPIMLVVLAIAALVGGLIYAYNHFKTFHDIVNTVFTAVKVTVMAVVNALIATWHALDTAAVATWHALVSAWNAVVTAALSVWHALEHAWNAVASVTSTVWNAIAGFFEKWWPLLLVIFLPPIAGLLALWNHFHAQIIGTVQAVWGAVSAFFVGAWHLIVAAASSAWQLFRQMIIEPIEAVWAFIQPTIHTIESFLSGMWHGILSVATAVWNSLKSALINPIIGAWHTIVSTVSSIASSIGSGLSSAWHAVENIGSKFLSIGSSIIEGIIHGIENGASSLFGSLENVAKGALNAAKSFLGINSPSKLFADHVGMAIPEGIAKGVNDHAQLAHKAVTDMAGALTGAAQTKVTSAFSLGTGAGSALGPVVGAGGGGTTITFDLRGSQVMSDRDMDQLVRKIGSAVATKILPQGGVRIRM